MSYLTPTIRQHFGAEYYSTRNYQNYLTRKFDLLAKEIADTCKLASDDSIVDFGCGYGGLVNAFWCNGFRRIHGTDISQWAIEHGQRSYPHLKSRLQFYNRDLLRRPHRLLTLLDVLEHMPEYEIEIVLKLARVGLKGCLVVRIPVCEYEGEPFILPVSNNDPTHITCHAKKWWKITFEKSGFSMRSLVHASTIYDSPGVLAAIYE